GGGYLGDVGGPFSSEDENESQDNGSSKRGRPLCRCLRIPADQEQPRAQDQGCRGQDQPSTGGQPMALKNILFVPFVPLLVVGVACTPQAESAGQTTTGLGFRDAPVRAELETVAVLTPLESETEVLWK